MGRFVYALLIALCRKERYTGLLINVEWKEFPSMASVLLLPDSAVLALVSIEVNEEEKMITATARTTSREAACPLCQRLAHRVQSKYVRVLADLPCSGQRVRWLIQVRRFWCQNTQCKRVIFTERLPSPTRCPDEQKQTISATRESDPPHGTRE